MSHESSLTQLPSGKFADYVWNGLSEPMQRVVLDIARKDVLCLQYGDIRSTTVDALLRRNLLASEYCLTEDGKALVEWIENRQRGA